MWSCSPLSLERKEGEGGERERKVRRKEGRRKNYYFLFISKGESVFM
jgi:hypothetical protein